MMMWVAYGLVLFDVIALLIGGALILESLNIGGAGADRAWLDDWERWQSEMNREHLRMLDERDAKLRRELPDLIRQGNMRRRIV